MTKALIVVDVQNDFISGTLAVPGAEDVARRIGTDLPTADYDIIVFTQDWHMDPGDHFSETPDFKDTWPVHCKAFSWGAQVSQEVIDGFFDRRVPEGCRMATFHKGMYSAAYSGFEAIENEYEAPLADWLRGFDVTDVDIVGIATDYCVKATALDAVKNGFTTTVLLPYCAAVTPETDVLARQEMEDAGVRMEVRV